MVLHKLNSRITPLFHSMNVVMRQWSLKLCAFWTFVIIFIIWLILGYLHESYKIDFWTKQSTCGDKVRGGPFYFGYTDVECMRTIRKRHKRSLVSYPLPERKFWSLNHRWVYYEGWYFELFYTPHTRRPAKSKFCRTRREPSPAGYSTINVDCLRKCAVYYNKRFVRRYNSFTHNCHHYANKIAEVLCTYSGTMCPDWCGEMYLQKGDPRLVNKSVTQAPSKVNVTVHITTLKTLP